MKLGILSCMLLAGLTTNAHATAPRLIIGAEITPFVIADQTTTSTFRINGLSTRGYAVGNKVIVSRLSNPTREITTIFAFYRTGVQGIQIIPKLGEFGYARAIAVNNVNEILGTFSTASTAYPEGGGTDVASVNLTNFMTTSAATFQFAGNEAVAINDIDDVLLRNTQGQGFLWPARNMPGLDQLLFPNSINDRRQIAGATIVGGVPVPAIYNEFNVIEPRPLPPTFTAGRFTRINRWKQCIGYAFNSTQTRFFFHSPISGYKLLGVGGGSGRTDVRGFNNNGWAVGRVGAQGMVWISGVDYSANQIMQGMAAGDSIEDVTAISDRNYMIALVRNTTTGLRWVMLEPAPPAP